MLHNFILTSWKEATPPRWHSHGRYRQVQVGRISSQQLWAHQMSDWKGFGKHLECNHHKQRVAKCGCMWLCMCNRYASEPWPLCCSKWCCVRTSHVKSQLAKTATLASLQTDGLKGATTTKVRPLLPWDDDNHHHNINGSRKKHQNLQLTEICSGPSPSSPPSCFLSWRD